MQKRDIRAWAKSHGHKVAHIHEDAGLSGSLEPVQRPGLSGALGAIQHGDASAIVVARLDRLARALTVQEAILARVWEANAQCFSLDLGEILRDDPSDPMRTAMRQMVGVFAQLERGMISARMRAGREMKHARGGYAYGAPPLGYRAADGALVADEVEQQVLERIRALSQTGNSLREIGAVLAQEGLKPKRGDRWHPETLRRLVGRLEARN